MRIRILTAAALGAALLVAVLLGAGSGSAQQPGAPAQNPLDVVPEKMPWNTLTVNK